MSEEAVEALLEALLFQRAELSEQRPMPDWEWVSAELGRRGVTLMLVWEEYGDPANLVGTTPLAPPKILLAPDNSSY
jgi:hypothetical protein